MSTSVSVCQMGTQRTQTYPFKTNEECLAEMMKHKPFGLVKYYDIFISIISIDDYSIEYLYNGDPATLNYKEAISHLKFINGAPFGIKEN